MPSSSGASGSGLGVPMRTSAALPTTRPTASARITSKAGSPDDTMRRTTRNVIPVHRARRQARGSQGEAMTTMATTEAISEAVAKRGSVISTSPPVSARTRSTTPRSDSARSSAIIAQLAMYPPSSSASARR